MSSKIARYTVHTELSQFRKIASPHFVLDTVTRKYVSDGYASKRAAQMEANEWNAGRLATED